MRMGTFKRHQWAEIDYDFKVGIREVLNLNDRSCLDYLYGSTSAGAMGMPVAAEEGDIFRLDSAFKLLSSKDPIIRDISKLELVLTVLDVSRKPATNAGPSTWLNKDQPDTVVGRTGNVDTIWTNARGAGS